MGTTTISNHQFKLVSICSTPSVDYTVIKELTPKDSDWWRVSTYYKQDTKDN